MVKTGNKVNYKKYINSFVFFHSWPESQSTLFWAKAVLVTTLADH